MYTKTQERVQIIDCGFCLKGIYWESKLPKFLPERTKTKLKPNEIFISFSISRDPIDAIDLDFCYFKGIDYKITQDPIGSDRT